MRLHGAIIENEYILSTEFLKYGSRTIKRAVSGMKVDCSTSIDLLSKSNTDAMKDIIPCMK